MNDIVYLNGSFIPRHDARISADDRGFHFADGVYEVVKYYRGVPFRLSDHLERLRHSLAALEIPFSGIDLLPRLFARLLLENGLEKADAAIYLQISRGSHFRVHHFPEIEEPTVYIFSYPFPSFHDNLKNGISVITAEDIRWLRCDIKSVALLANTMLYQKAVALEAGETLLVRDGLVTEATHSSVFAIVKSQVYTHPLSNLILPGITRKVLLEICRKEKIPVFENPISAGELTRVDELLVCGTGGEVIPVIRVNGIPVGNGDPGTLTRFLQRKFFEEVGSETGTGIEELGLRFLE